jgi:ABC-type transport system involved in cytochrome c biogenesis permease component
MNTSRLQSWIGPAVLVGVVYLLIGRFFPNPPDPQRAWRLAAWGVSGVVFASHICYELFRLRHSPRSMALHLALAVALGAFVLAIAGALHSLSTSSSIRPAWLLALIVWPLVTAVPAFVIALVAGVLLSPGKA